jgi:hypothetical protein
MATRGVDAVESFKVFFFSFNRRNALASATSKASMVADFLWLWPGPLGFVSETKTSGFVTFIDFFCFVLIEFSFFTRDDVLADFIELFNIPVAAGRRFKGTRARFMARPAVGFLGPLCTYRGDPDFTFISIHTIKLALSVIITPPLVGVKLTGRGVTRINLGCNPPGMGPNATWERHSAHADLHIGSKWGEDDRALQLARTIEAYCQSEKGCVCCGWSVSVFW